MSRIPRDARVLAAASTLALAALGAASTTANAANVSLNYQCTYPLIGTQPLKIAIDAAIPVSYAVNSKTPPFTIKAIASPGGDTASGLNLILSLEGAAVANATLTSPGMSPLKLEVPISIDKYAIPSSGALALNANGTTPQLSFTNAGTATVTLQDLTLNLIARDTDGNPIQLPPVGTDSDGNADTFDVNCKLDSGQSPLLSTITLTDGTETPDSSAPSVPGGLTGSATSSSTASLSWSASTDNVGVVSYEVFANGTLLQTVQGTSTTLGGLDPSTSYSFTVKARDAANNRSDASGALKVTTPAGTPLNTPVNYKYSLAGSAILKTLTQGSLPVSGAIAANINLSTGAFHGPLTLNNTQGSLKLIGFVPVTAKIGFVPVGETTGTLKDGVLTATAVETIRLPQLYLFGGIPVAGAGGCRTKAPSTINLRSMGSAFNPLKGGVLSGRFNLGELTDCGALTGIISPLAQGGPNSISVTLTPNN